MSAAQQQVENLQHDRYPMFMKHPGYWPGSVGPEVTDESGFKHNAGGLPARFPPVQVENADQEEQYAAKGYVPAGKSDPTAHLRLIASAGSGNYDHQEYPKQVGDRVANSAEEEAAIRASDLARAREADTDANWHQPSAQPAPAAIPPVDAPKAPEAATRDPAGETRAERIARLRAELEAAETEEHSLTVVEQKPARVIFPTEPPRATQRAAPKAKPKAKAKKKAKAKPPPRPIAVAQPDQASVESEPAALPPRRRVAEG